MKNKNKPLKTDFYQFTMAYAYLMTGIADQITGFESFVRYVKADIVGPKKDYLLFKGENDINEFMKEVKKVFNDKTTYKKIWKAVKVKLDKSIDKKQAKKQYFAAVEKFMTKTDFEYTVLKDNTKIYSLVPAFQFKGPKLIGQIIETPITNIINGQTGFNSLKQLNEDFSKELLTQIENILYPEINNKDFIEYCGKMNTRAIEYRNSTTKPIAEAAFRRAGNYDLAYMASIIALINGWDFTSNTSVKNKSFKNQLTGTMAHTFIMSFKTEEEAFIAWNKIFPNSTMLIDTYNCVNAVQTLIRLNIKPRAVRIDSDPLDQLTFEVRRELDKAGWQDVKIFISGDITPEILKDFEARNVPYDISMAGTKYANIEPLNHINCGFVYKVVEFTNEKGETFYPVKKAFGKSNYPGLKNTIYYEDTNEIIMTIKTNGEFGFKNLEKIKTNSLVRFIEL